jgi:hypothetical protein
VGPIDRASPYLRRIQSPKRCVLKYKQDGVMDKNRAMDNVQKHDICPVIVAIFVFLTYIKMVHTELVGVILIFRTKFNTSGSSGRGFANKQKSTYRYRFHKVFMFRLYTSILYSQDLLLYNISA